MVKENAFEQGSLGARFARKRFLAQVIEKANKRCLSGFAITFALHRTLFPGGSAAGKLTSVLRVVERANPGALDVRAGFALTNQG